MTTGIRRARELRIRAQNIAELRKLEWSFEITPTRECADKLAMLRDEIRMSEEKILEMNESHAKLAEFQAMCDE